VISTGTVDLATRDVAEIRDRVISVLEAHDGVLADERTTTDEKGRTSYARLALRVPAEDFAAVMDQLAGLGRLVDSSRKSEDVTTEVIDVDQRVEVQRTGLRRTVALLDRADTLSDILKIEDEITRRRADLDSLVGQQRYLRSQTSLSTITVTVDRTPPAPVAHTGGFVGGLRSGWDGLTGFLGSAPCCRSRCCWWCWHHSPGWYDARCAGVAAYRSRLSRRRRTARTPSAGPAGRDRSRGSPRGRG
jgi:hypothetical protein